METPRRFLAALSLVAFASAATADTDPVTLALDKTSYVPGEVALLTITGTPGSPVILFIDTQPGTFELPGGYGTLDLAFTPTIKIIPMLTIPGNGELVLDCLLDCDSGALGINFYIQALSADIFTLEPCITNRIELFYEDDSDVCCSGRIGDFVWLDDGDNVQGPGDTGIEGVTVILKNEAGEAIATTVTDADGHYEFTDLCAGCYYVCPDADTVPGGLAPVLCDFGGDDSADSDCTPLKVILETDDDEDLDADFGYGPCNECDGKVTGLTIRYLGDGPAALEIIQKDGDLTVFDDTVENGDVFTIVHDPSKSTFGSEIKLYIDDVEVEKIHTSCSKPIGPGLVFGDFEILAGSSKDGGLLCDLGNDLCGPGKPACLSLIYTGDDCSATSHSQDESKVGCSGDPMFASPVRIVVYDGNDVFFDGEVELGQAFEVAAANADEDQLGSNTDVDIYDLEGNLLQQVFFHTSCSQDLFKGNQFGALEVDALCEGPEPAADDCDAGDPKALGMRYTGEGCDATVSGQSSDKVNCDGDPAFATPVHIVSFNGDKVYFDGVVELNGTFTIDAENAGDSKLKSATFVEIFDMQGNLLQEIEFHTSCSQPLGVGNQFGSLVLEVFTPEGALHVQDEAVIGSRD